MAAHDPKSGNHEYLPAPDQSAHSKACKFSTDDC
jgi:hypothetical protein